METVANKNLIKGGEFLIKDITPEEIFTPEDFTEEQRMLIQACKDFLEKEVYPKVEALDEAKDTSLMVSLLDKAAELGLLGAGVPEEYGGMGMDFNSTMLIAEYLGAGHSFAVAFSAHTGIGTLPIQYYGNEEQKKKYLPKLASGEWKAAYCLTEPDSGSDANSGKTKATLSEDGKYYIINGQKMWITNGGFADLYIVFAKIDNDKNLSAFIVEKDFGGITMNPPEKKMGIKGSDTRQIFFNDCKVPVENLLSERENGFKIAVNILNIGRIKLAASAVGASKAALSHAIRYANERKQFGRLISSFGAIKHKIAESAVKIFASEAATYRAGQNIEDAIKMYKEAGMSDSEAKLESLKQFAIECAMMKVHASEVLDYVVDEAVQIYGGMGYSAESPVERAYRDSRINRIFEGTNEINRLLTVDMILRRAMQGELDVMGPAMAVAKELMAIPDFGAEADTSLFAAELKAVKNFKKAILMVAGAAAQKLGKGLGEEQEIIMNVADMLIETYVTESVLLRVLKMAQKQGEEATALYQDLARVYLYDAADVIQKAAREAITAFAEGDELRVMLLGLKRFTKLEPFNVKAARRRIADYLIEKNEYAF
ncbi:alkylation response protein AidB-like acyl-CoA dehydrogenase [Thermonema lapsum]|jgi:alkylation response protein AidB-like acyl-CoA dehydrogenase|uniref:Alkylation response protein AidB-like acyl-CoA dehydrogenase n=1 Tax=Thermonema lapsum TaxID=28195 RepID=A0A846MS33_9BACT|nr:acyl-CoA dehydrogenase family protein [Thermonema lapsum]NIK74269.1 alkylation response protein AidB-like acyl-CoA dehydrogenase [Thermonema lapsum]